MKKTTHFFLNEQALTETTFFILLSLALKPRHGYGIMKDVKTMSAGRIDLSAGTLYKALKRLLDLEWISRTDERGLAEESRRSRKEYALTDLGRRMLQAETARLRSLVKIADPRLTKDIACSG